MPKDGDYLCILSNKHENLKFVEINGSNFLKARYNRCSIRREHYVIYRASQRKKTAFASVSPSGEVIMMATKWFLFHRGGRNKEDERSAGATPLHIIDMCVWWGDEGRWHWFSMLLYTSLFLCITVYLILNTFFLLHTLTVSHIFWHSPPSFFFFFSATVSLILYARLLFHSIVRLLLFLPRTASIPLLSACISLRLWLCILCTSSPH